MAEFLLVAKLGSKRDAVQHDDPGRLTAARAWRPDHRQERRKSGPRGDEEMVQPPVPRLQPEEPLRAPCEETGPERGRPQARGERASVHATDEEIELAAAARCRADRYGRRTSRMPSGSPRETYCPGSKAPRGSSSSTVKRAMSSVNNRRARSVAFSAAPGRAACDRAGSSRGATAIRPRPPASVHRRPRARRRIPYHAASTHA